MEVKWDDALLALPAGREELDSDKNPIFRGVRVRMGIHSGRAQSRINPTHHRTDYYGPVVDRANRVSDAAHGGQIIITQECWDEIQKVLKGGDENKEYADALKELNFVSRDLGAHNLKGIHEPVQLYEGTLCFSLSLFVSLCLDSNAELVLPGSLKARSAVFPPPRSLGVAKVILFSLFVSPFIVNIADFAICSLSRT